MNKQIYALYGVTQNEYLAWCKEVKKPSYKLVTKRDFFARLQDGRLVRDEKTFKLVKRNKGDKNDKR